MPVCRVSYSQLGSADPGSAQALSVAASGTHQHPAPQHVLTGHNGTVNAVTLVTEWHLAGLRR